MKRRLNELANITMGQSPSSEFYNANRVGTPFLQGCTTFGRIYPKYDTWTTSFNKEANSGDVLFTVRAPVGDVNICKIHTAIGRGLAAISAKTVLSKYLFYLLQANKSLFMSSSSGTIYQSINKDKLGLVELAVHSDEEQQHIVGTIGSVDDCIENISQRILKTLEEIDFLFSMVERNEYCETFSSVFTCLSGYPFKSNKYNEKASWNVITIKNISDAGFDSRGCSRIDYDNEYSRFVLEPGDLLLTMTGNVGRTGIIDSKRCLLNQRVLKVEGISKGYLLGYLRKYKKELIGMAKGTAQKNLSLDDIKKLPVFNTKDEIQTMNTLDTNYSSLLSLMIRRKQLRSIKDLLLKKYF